METTRPRFTRVGQAYFRQDTDGQLYAVSDKDTLKGLQAGQLPYESKGTTVGLKFASQPDVNSQDIRSLDFGAAASAAGGASTPASSQYQAPTAVTGGSKDVASLIKEKLIAALTNYKGVSNTADLEAKRQELLRKRLLAPTFASSESESILSPDQQNALLRTRGAEYDPLITSLEKQILQAKQGDTAAIDNITKIASAAKSLGIDLGGEAGGYESAIGKEWQDYVRDEKTRGTPEGKIMSLNEYATYDSNRKRSITNIINAAGLTNQQTNTAMKLSDDYEARSKDFYIVRDGYNRVIAAAKDPSAAGDIALIFSYMKTLDPNSVVRETEFATAESAGSVPERVWAQYNKVLEGERLSPTQRADFVDRSKRLYIAAKEQQDRIAKEFSDRATQYDIPVNLVVRETTANESYAPSSSGPAKGTDGASYGHPGYVSDGTQWVKK